MEVINYGDKAESGRNKREIQIYLYIFGKGNTVEQGYYELFLPSTSMNLTKYDLCNH